MLVNEAPTGGDPVDGGDDPGDHLDPVPVWLEGPSDATPPLIATRPQVLPFEQLTPENFERLVLKLARRFGDVVHAQLYGYAAKISTGSTCTAACARPAPPAGSTGSCSAATWRRRRRPIWLPRSTTFSMARGRAAPTSTCSPPG